MKGVFIDRDQELKYETNSLFRKLLNIFFIPILTIFPTSLIHLLKKINKDAEDMVEYATTHKAMEIIYDVKPRSHMNFLQNYFLSIWLNINNSRAVRNRLKLVKREIKKKIVQLSDNNVDINMVNIASGSARAVLEAIKESNINDKIKISALFIDRNHDAIIYSQKLAKAYELNANLKWINDTADNYIKQNSNIIKFNIAEIVGLLEYLNDEDIIKLFSVVYKSLDSEGILVTSNVLNNPEKRFMSNSINWKMTYRSVDELSSLLISAGFSLDNMKIYLEPQKIHCVIVAQK